MGQVFSASNKFNAGEISVMGDGETPKTPADANSNFFAVDPRSPTYEYDRTPIRIDKAGGDGSNASLNNDENSPISSKAGSRTRSLHQRLMVKKMSSQES
ncbi:unnamed protein product [Auanema sp. JU1783]|nr:unnamed protein product [Auanema sp. JU1783]